MASQVTRPSVPPRSSRGSRWRNAVLMLALATLAGGGGVFWQRQARLSGMRTALPAVNTDGANATLRERITRAEAAARTQGDAERVADLASLPRRLPAGVYSPRSSRVKPAGTTILPT